MVELIVVYRYISMRKFALLSATLLAICVLCSFGSATGEENFFIVTKRTANYGTIFELRSSKRNIISIWDQQELKKQLASNKSFDELPLRVFATDSGTAIFQYRETVMIFRTGSQEPVVIATNLANNPVNNTIRPTFDISDSIVAARLSTTGSELTEQIFVISLSGEKICVTLGSKGATLEDCKLAQDCFSDLLKQAILGECEVASGDFSFYRIPLLVHFSEKIVFVDGFDKARFCDLISGACDRDPWNEQPSYDTCQFVNASQKLIVDFFPKRLFKAIVLRKLQSSAEPSGFVRVRVRDGSSEELHSQAFYSYIATDSKLRSLHAAMSPMQLLEKIGPPLFIDGKRWVYCTETMACSILWLNSSPVISIEDLRNESRIGIPTFLNSFIEDLIEK